MKMLVYRRAEINADDISCIVRACSCYDYEISRADAELAWAAHSNEYAAQWLFVDGTNEEIVEIIKKFCDEVEE